MICANKRIPNPASLPPDERMKYRDSFVGKSSTRECLPDGSAIYTHDDNGRFYLTVFAGKALRTFIHGWYRTDISRANVIETFKRNRAEYHANRILRRQAAKRPHTLKVGDILYTSWGYEQTSVEFYEVIAVSGVMVTLRQIAAHHTEEGYMRGRKTPCPGHFIGEPFRRRAGANNAVRIHSSASAWYWDGRPKWYNHS